MVTLTLPFPPSANRIWRVSHGRTHRSSDYEDWRALASQEILQQRKNAGEPVTGHFTYHIVLDEKRRARARDGDNRQKAVLDLLQHCGMIADDKFADGGSWSWGPVEKDTCLVRVYPVNRATL